MDKNDQSHLKLSSGSMLNIFLESYILDQIKKIQKNQNLKDERDVVIRAIEHYYENIISAAPKQKDKFDEGFSKTVFDGEIDELWFSIISSVLRKPEHFNWGSRG